MVDFNEHTRTTDLVQKLQIARRELKLEAAINRLDCFDLLILDDFEPLGHLFAPDGHRRRCSGTITFLMSDPRRLSMPMPDRNYSHRRDAVSVGFTRSDGGAVNRR
jgi:hypothetical protein